MPNTCQFCEKPIVIHKIPIPNNEFLLVPLEHFECQVIETKMMRLQLKLRQIQDKIQELRLTQNKLKEL